MFAHCELWINLICVRCQRNRCTNEGENPIYDGTHIAQTSAKERWSCTTKTWKYLRRDTVRNGSEHEKWLPRWMEALNSHQYLWLVKSIQKVRQVYGLRSWWPCRCRGVLAGRKECKDDENKSNKWKDKLVSKIRTNKKVHNINNEWMPLVIGQQRTGCHCRGHRSGTNSVCEKNLDNTIYVI